jgi:hypothetical protein
VNFTVPAGEGMNKTIKVSVDGQESNTNMEFSYNGFIYFYFILFFLGRGLTYKFLVGPIINDVQPQNYSTAGGTTLSIKGANFGAGSPSPIVQFNNQDIEVCCHHLF